LETQACALREALTTKDVEMNEEPERRAPIVLLVGAAAMIVLLGALYLASRYAPATVTPPDQPLPMGAAEQAYAPQVEFVDMKVARATNFLNQEATFVFGTTANNGPRSIRQVEVTFEFHDVFQQVVLRDKQRLFGPSAAPLAPSQTRDFQLTYDTMPAQWNQAPPSVHITGLALE
jgi:hypothetical protein